MSDIIKHIQELVRYSNYVQIRTIKFTLEKETRTSDKELEENIKRRVEAIEYLKNNERINFTIHEDDDDNCLITIELAE